MVAPPTYLQASANTQTAILARMLEAFSALEPGTDISEGSFATDPLRAAAVELALAAAAMTTVLERGFIRTTYGLYLDARAEEHGVFRKPAVAATGLVTVTGTAGTVIPAGTRLAVAGAAPPIYTTDAAATIPAGGAIDVAVTAVAAGQAGNAAPGAISILPDGLNGIASVTNALAITGGLDTESDAVLRARTLRRIANPGSSGNTRDYINWALDVTGVGAADCVPHEDGPGTVAVYVIGSDGLPANQALVEKVQVAIAPPYTALVPATALAILDNHGVTTYDGDDGLGTRVRLSYDGGGPGTLAHNATTAALADGGPGIWTVRARLIQGGSTDPAGAVQLGVWNNTAGAWAKIAPTGDDEAVRTLGADVLGTAPGWWSQEFYWNGTDAVTARVIRLATDVDAVVDVVDILYASTFTRDNGTGTAPIGARVTVKPAIQIDIDVAVQLLLRAGYSAATVETAVTAAIAAYVVAASTSLSDRTIRYTDIAAAISGVPGVADYRALYVNSAMANIVIPRTSVAVLVSCAYDPWNAFDAASLTWDGLDALALSWNNLNGAGL